MLNRCRLLEGKPCNHATDMHCLAGPERERIGSGLAAAASFFLSMISAHEVRVRVCI